MLGKNLKYYREKKKMSRDELAKKCGYKNGTFIQSIESGKRTPSFKKNKEIANALGISIQELIGEKAPEGLSLYWDKLTTRQKNILVNQAKVFTMQNKEDDDFVSYIQEKLKDNEFRNLVLPEINYKKTDKKSDKEEIKALSKMVDRPKSDLDDYFMLESTLNNLPKKERKKALKETSIKKESERHSMNKVLKRQEEDSKIRALIERKGEAEISLTQLDNLSSAVITVRGSKPIKLISQVPKNEGLIDVMLQGLRYANDEKVESVRVLTSSDYLYNSLTIWIKTWSKNNWKKITGDDVLYKEMWEEVNYLMTQIKIKPERRKPKW